MKPKRPLPRCSDVLSIAFPYLYTKKTRVTGLFCFERSVLAPSYSRLSTTIASGGLNCRVRNENGCTPSDEAPTQKAQKLSVLLDHEELHKQISHYACVRDSHNSLQKFCRGIQHIAVLPPSAYQRGHLPRPSTIPYLGVRFPLRCFQRLSVPDIATGRCHWCDSPQTRGRFNSVLSY